MPSANGGARRSADCLFDEDRNIVMEYATTSHTAALVPLFAKGPGADRLGGLKRNDQVGKILASLMDFSSD